MVRTKVYIPFLIHTLEYWLIIVVVALPALILANRPQMHRRSVSIYATFAKCSKLIISLPGKAPRKQLATKAARKTAQVCWSSSSSSSPSAISDSNFFVLFILSRPPLEVSRSPTDSAPVLSLYVKSEGTKSSPSSSSASSPSRGSFVRSLRTSRLVLKT